MTRTRPIARPLTPTRTAPIPPTPAGPSARAFVLESEPLEPRRMFAGWMPRGDGFGPPHHGNDYGLYAERSAPQTVAILFLPWGGRMSVTSDGRSTTASSTPSLSAANASSDTTPNSTPGTTPDTQAAPTAIAGDALYGRPSLPTARPAADVAPADVAMTPDAADGSPVDAATRATPDIAPAAGLTARTETHDQMAERVFGPFAIVDAPTAQAAPTGTGLASLLNADRGRTDSLLRQATATSARSRRSGPADAELDAAPIVVAESPAAAGQASLAALVQGPSAQPVWQRIAVLTAGVTLAAANWVVRRRARRAAAIIDRV